MKGQVSKPVQDRILKAVDNKMALHFQEEHWQNLLKKLLPAAKDLGFEDMNGFVRYLELPELPIPELEILASHLTVGETYFWREPQSFKALELNILPKIIRKQRQGEKRIRIWSAGCSSGEEAYSLAIALKRNIPDIKNWNISILATDINSDALHKAQKAVYGSNSFRNAPKWLTENYFIKRKDGKREVIPEIKKMVTIKHLNLADGAFPSILNDTNARDIIFCRNVLMYFSKERAKNTISKLFQCLVDEGILVVSLSELSQELFEQFNCLRLEGTTFYQRISYKQVYPPWFEDQKMSFRNQNLDLPPVNGKLLGSSKQNNARKKTAALDSYKPAASVKKVNSVEVTKKQTDNKSVESAGVEDDPVFRIKKLADQGDLKSAVNACEEAIKTNKVDARLRFLYANILQENGENDKAVESLNVAKYLDPKFILAYYSLANIYFQMGKIRQAKKDYENAISLLKDYKADEMIPESEGLTAGRIREIIQSTIKFRKLS